MEIKDYKFHYKHVIRYMVIHNLYSYNYNSINMPVLNKGILFFNIYEIEDMDNICSSNYFYFFKFFFGNKAVLTNFNSIFRLNIVYYSFTIQFLIKQAFMYTCICFLVQDVFPFLNQKYLEIEFYIDSIIFIILDMTLFTEKKINFGFFNLKHDLNCKFIFSGCGNDVEFKEVYLNYLKLIY